MAASLLGWIWTKDVSATAKLVLFALNEHTNIGEHGDWRVFPSHDRVAKMCGLSKRSVIRAMKELTDAGIVTVAHQHDNKGRQLQNLYWLQAPKLIEEEGCHKVTPEVNYDTPEGDKLSHKSLNKNPFNKTIYTRKKNKTPIPEDFGISDGVRKWAERHGHRRLNAHLENFIDTALAGDYRYVNWDSAFKTAIRKNWANLK